MSDILYQKAFRCLTEAKATSDEDAGQTLVLEAMDCINAFSSFYRMTMQDPHQVMPMLYEAAETYGLQEFLER